jgi:hypothetical protein
VLSIRVGWCKKNHLGPIGVIRHLDGDRLILLQAQHRAGHLAVVGGRLDPVARRQIERDGHDVDLVIGRRGIRCERGK